MVRPTTSSTSPVHLPASPGHGTTQPGNQPGSPEVRPGSRRMAETELQHNPRASTASSPPVAGSRPSRAEAPARDPGELSRSAMRSGTDLEAGTAAAPPEARSAASRLMRTGRQWASGAVNLAQGSVAQVRDGTTAGAAYVRNKAVAGQQYAAQKMAQGAHYAAAKAQQGWEATSAFAQRGAQDLVGDRLPSRAAVGAFAGHTLQQLLTCGIPTFSREYAMLQIYRGIVNSKFAQDNPFAVVGMQSAVSMMAIVAHAKLRHARMDRDPEAAVKGHFGLTNAQWEALPPEARQKRIAVQQADSRRVTANQVIAEMGNFTMGSVAAAHGDPTVAARIFATQARNVIYAGMRELMQASIKFVDTRGPATSGVNDANMSSMAAVYTLMTMGASTASDAVVTAALSARSVGLNGLQFRTADTVNPLRTPQLNNAALVAVIRALFNTSVEVIDAGVGKHYETKQVGAQQVWNSGDKLPFKDHDRVFDHSIARFSWNQLAGMANLAVQQVGKAAGLNASAPAVTSFLGVGSTAAAFGLAYRNTNQTYQAHARVRSAVAAAAQQAARPAQAEQAAPAAPRVTLTDIVEEAPPPAPRERRHSF